MAGIVGMDIKVKHKIGLESSTLVNFFTFTIRILHDAAFWFKVGREEIAPLDRSRCDWAENSAFIVR
jgi:hypothetical protein